VLGCGPSDESRMLNVFREVCAVSTDNGAEFDVDGLTAEPMREQF
jgi:hypothetical protein